MNTCKTCKWWQPAHGGGYCNCSKLREPEPYCEAATPFGQPDELVYSYNEGGSFWTGPEFGCVHHHSGENHGTL